MTKRPRVDIVCLDASVPAADDAREEMLQLAKLIRALGLPVRVVCEAGAIAPQQAADVDVVTLPSGDPVKASVARAVSEAVRDAGLVVVSPAEHAATLATGAPVIGIVRRAPWRTGPGSTQERDVEARVVPAVARCAVCIVADADALRALGCFDPAAAARARRIPPYIEPERFPAVPKRFDGRLEVLVPAAAGDEGWLRDAVAAFDALLPVHASLDVHLVCAADEDARIAEAFAKRHPARARHSRADSATLPGALASSHVVVLSGSDAATDATWCLRAMATRHAIVASDRSGAADCVIDGWSAVLVEPGAGRLAAAIARLAGDRSLVERLAVNALTTVGAFDLRRWQAHWQSVLHDVLPDHVPNVDGLPVASVAPGGLEAQVEQSAADAQAATAAQQFAEQQHYWSTNELAGIKASTGWALLQQLYRVRFAAFPRGSRREAMAKSMMHGARRLWARASGGGGATPAPAAGAAAGTPPVVALLPPSVPTVPMPYTVVCLPVLDWNFRFQRPQQLALRFAAAGHDVLFAKHSFGNALTARMIQPRIEEVELPGAAGTNPYRDRLGDADADVMARALLGHLASRHAGRFVCVVQLPFWAPLASRLRAMTGCDVVYDCMDLHAGFSSNTETALSDERRLLAEADVVVCSSDMLLEHARPQARRVALVRNGVDHAHFVRVADHEHPQDGTLTVGYYGAIADWFDSELVAAVARLRPQWRIVLIGSTWSADTAPLEAAPNITLAGERPYAELPALIADWDCCLIPFLHTPLTDATNPVKVYEMLAAGKPVVSVHLPELGPMAEAGLVTLAEGAEAFVRAIEEAVRSDSEARRNARRAFAAENTWEIRRQAFDGAIDAIEPLVSIVVVTYNNRALNELCLASVLRDTDWPALEVIVVDNASGDGTPALLQSIAAADPRVRVLLNTENRGFAAANNQGTALAAGRYLCFLNNDTVVHGGWLRTLVGHLRRHAHLGLVGPVTNAIGNEARIPVGYEDLAAMPAWADAHCAAHRGELDGIPMLAFFCVVVPRDVWQRVGALDERFGAGMFEDDDYNRRVRAAGFDVQLARDSFVHHWQRASFKLLGEDEYLRIYRENQARYASKWGAEGGEALAPLRRAATSAIATVVFAPSVGWAIPLAQRPHHIARVLAQDGYAVVFDCSNASDEVDTLREIEPRLFLYKGPPAALAGLPRTVLWTFSYNHDYRDALPGDVRVVYDWIDDLGVFPYDQRKLAAMHARALRESDLVICVARRLHEQAVRERPDARYVPNAVEEGRFEREPQPNPALADPAFAPLVASGRPIAGYYGALAHWFDYPLLAEVAKRRSDWSFVLIGPDHDGSLARSGVTSLPNVHALGPRAYASLPGYLHHFDVATIPFAINDITLATSPLKLYEYFAAGKPVISTPMPECMAFDAVAIVRDAQAFADALDPARAAGGDAGHVAKLRSLAKANTWRARATEVMDALVRRGGAPSSSGGAECGGEPTSG